MEKAFFVYIVTNKPKGVLYIGVTSNLPHRIHQHRTGAVSGFTKKYNLHRLVYVGPHETAETAIHREKALKRWKRSWKIELIESLNPDWADLFDRLNA